MSIYTNDLRGKLLSFKNFQKFSENWKGILNTFWAFNISALKAIIKRIILQAIKVFWLTVHYFWFIWACLEILDLCSGGSFSWAFWECKYFGLGWKGTLTGDFGFLLIIFTMTQMSLKKISENPRALDVYPNVKIQKFISHSPLWSFLHEVLSRSIEFEN